MALIGSSSPDSSCSSSGALTASQPLYSVFLLFVVRSCSFSAQLSGRSSGSLYTCVFDFAHRKEQSQPSPSCRHLGPPRGIWNFIGWQIHPQGENTDVRRVEGLEQGDHSLPTLPQSQTDLLLPLYLLVLVTVNSLPK